MKEYIGDGVYVEFVGGVLTLTTENGVEVTNAIVLEHDVFIALLAYAQRQRGAE
jgi:hypothetical protein